MQLIPSAERADLDAIDACNDLVMEFFKDRSKADLWWSTGNPLLGGIAPVEFVKLAGRPFRLLRLIKEWQAGNF